MKTDWTEKEYDQVRQIREIVQKYSIGTEGIWEICKFLRAEFPGKLVESLQEQLQAKARELGELRAVAEKMEKLLRISMAAMLDPTIELDILEAQDVVNTFTSLTSKTKS